MDVRHTALALGLVVLCGASPLAHAVPSLLFSGSFDYEAANLAHSDNRLTISASLIGAEDVAPPPDLSSSSMTLVASLDLGDVASSGSLVTAVFGSGPFSPDLTVADSGGDLLLGDLLSATMASLSGFGNASFTGEIQTTGGSLLGDFGSGASLLAFQFNLDRLVSADMFLRDFSGAINGRLEAIPVPGAPVLALLAMLPVLGLAVRRGRHRRRAA